MRQFYELFPEEVFTQQVAAQITMVPWGHILTLLTKWNNNPLKALFYIRKTIENGWSRLMLEIHLETNLYDMKAKKEGIPASPTSLQHRSSRRSWWSALRPG